MTTMIESPIETRSTQQVWFGTWRNIALQCCDTAATIEDIEGATKTLVDLSKQKKSGVVSLSVLKASGVASLGDVERKRAVEFVQRSASAMRVGVQVVENDGFVGAMLRSVIAGVNLLSKSPTKVFSSQKEALDYLIEHRYARDTLRARRNDDLGPRPLARQYGSRFGEQLTLELVDPAQSAAASSSSIAVRARTLRAILAVCNDRALSDHGLGRAPHAGKRAA
jgi:hypothetical protein